MAGKAPAMGVQALNRLVQMAMAKEVTLLMAMAGNLATGWLPTKKAGWQGSLVFHGLQTWGALIHRPFFLEIVYF